MPLALLAVVHARAGDLVEARRLIAEARRRDHASSEIKAIAMQLK
jgi:hypothetical protein